MLRVILTAAALTALPFGAVAETPKAALHRMVKMLGQKYVCKVEKRGANAGWLAHMGYRLSFFKETGQVTVRATPYGYSNSFEARGRCQTF